ncbi:major royal jelly family protein [Priestia koreensis]|uniref:major royal jelly family protein n=1 Tax=Priestia koreensis TaxID=284581 RepID=UPI001F562751|nr:major royal jelly family protein [Priestia koreensis]UNL83061.1 gluconolactonase [Priestia koreensis]
MRNWIISSVIIASMIGCPDRSHAVSSLETVTTFDKERPGNLATTSDGRIIVTMSALSHPTVNVREILQNNKTRAFPNLKWASKPTDNEMGIERTIGIKVSSKGTVWMLDMGSEDLRRLPKLVGWNTKTERIEKVLPIPKESLSNHPFLHDFVIDEKRHKFYIADMDFSNESKRSERPALIVVDMKNGQTSRILEGIKPFMPSGDSIRVNGKIISSKTSAGTLKAHQYGLNPISIDPQGEWVYFGAMSGTDVFRIRAEKLSTLPSGSKETKNVEWYSKKPHCDGFVVDDKGNIYVTDIEQSAIGISNPKGYRIVIKDDQKLQWPDGLSIGTDHFLYITVNQLNTLPELNGGVDESKPPYYVHRMNIKSLK